MRYDIVEIDFFINIIYITDGKIVATRTDEKLPSNHEGIIKSLLKKDIET